MSATAKKKGGFSREEKAAMRARAKELKAAAEGEEAVRAALAKMAPDDRDLGERIHALVTETTPGLTPRTWYGMPAYANEDGKVVCYFKDSGKFKARYSEFGFNDPANLDDGAMWPIVYALTTKLSKTDEATLAKLLRQALS